MPIIKLRDIELYYEQQGHGPRLLYISGTGGDLRRKPNIFDLPIARHFEILAFDQRGMGQTSRPDIPYTMADYADDIHALLLAVGWETCAVLGVSFGGMVAQELALRYPQHVERLVLCCTSSGGAGGASYPLLEFAHLSAEQYAQTIVPLNDTRHGAAWQAEHPKAYAQLYEQVLAAKLTGADEPNRRTGALRQLQARAKHNTYDRLVNLPATLPVLLCGGKFDGICPAENLDAIARQISHAELAMFEGGHLFLNQDPAAFKRITQFLLGA